MRGKLFADFPAVAPGAGVHVPPPAIRRKEHAVHTRVFRDPQITNASIGLTMLLIGVAWLSPAYAAEKVKVTGSWQDGVPHDLTFTRVLVIGVTPDVNQRCRWERFLAAKLNGTTTKAVASCDAVTKVDPLTLESIQDAVEWLKVDAVVATSLVAREWKEEEGGGRDTRGTSNYKATDAGYAYGYYGMYGVPVVYGEFVATPAVTTISGTAHVTTKVYATQDQKVVYTLDTKAQSSDFRERSMSSVTTPMAEKLRRDGLIR
jgi:hypothetical protein